MKSMNGESRTVERTPIVMCAACWRIQAPEDELVFDSDQWVDPTTFMAHADAGPGGYYIMDGYCDPCLTAFVSRLQDVKNKTAHERLNA
jgi:hypothetical protein